MTESSVAAISDYPKARWWASVGIIVALVGAAVSTAWFVWGLNRVDDGLDGLIVVAGSQPVRVPVAEAVDWTVYLEPSDRSLSGVRFDVVDTSTGEPVTLEPPRNDVDYSVGDRTGRPISRARLDAGEYLVEVSPDDVVLAIGPDVGDRVQWMWLGAVLIAIPTVLGGGVVAAVNLLRALRPARPRPGRRDAEGGDEIAPSGSDSAAPAREEASRDVGTPADSPPTAPPAAPTSPTPPATDSSLPTSPPAPPSAGTRPPSAPPSAERPPLPPPDPSQRRDR